MASVNKVIIVGNLGADPEVRYMPNGDAVTTISVATTERWKDKQTGETQEATEWHRVSFYGRMAEVAGEYLKKGSQVYIEGSLRTKKYTDKSGIERYATGIRADEMKMLGSRQDGGAQPQRQAPQQRQAAPQRQQPPANTGSGFDDMDDDIPF